MPRADSEKRVTRSSRHKPYQMTEVEKNNQEVFLSTGRTGRRNALANILDDKYAGVSTASLPTNLSGLRCDDEENTKPKEHNDGTNASTSAPSTISEEKEGKEKSDSKKSSDSPQCSKSTESNEKTDSSVNDNVKCDKTESKTNR